MTFSEIARRTQFNANHALLGTVAVSRSHTSRVMRGTVEASKEVGRAIALALEVDYYVWLRSVHRNQDRFRDFVRESAYPETIDLAEFEYLLYKNLSIVKGVNGFEAHSSDSYKYANIKGFTLQDAQKRLDDYLAILQVGHTSETVLVKRSA